MTKVPVAGPAVAVMVATPGARARRWSPSTATIEGRLLVYVTPVCRRLWSV